MINSSTIFYHGKAITYGFYHFFFSIDSFIIFNELNEIMYYLIHI